MGKYRYLAVALLVIGAAFFTSWLLRTLGETPLIKTAINREPDYFFDDFTATSKDVQGKIRYRLEATQLQHFPYNDSMRLNKPYIELFNTQQGKPWQTWAEQGLFFEKRQLLTLTGKVRLHRAADATGPSATLLTDSITLDMQSKIASTTADVQITSGEDILNATGMMVDLESGRVELHSQVQGKYAVPKQQ